MTTDSAAALPVEGMSCDHCAERVTEALEGVEGVSHASVDLEAGQATLKAADHVSCETLAEAVDEAGYEVPAD
ncbi:heavy-metal-associated domain-containing protein [Salinibacter sp.]|uniref:heavy-metal-associated domain-containing protein n=1 Tax=Salinibacter sp. TaxID=2065818 RepID=UPI0021E71BA3|nr:heavy metal-associated domain-containing protein [Salinibacter sp.]